MLEEDNLSRDQGEVTISGRELMELELREAISQGKISAARDFLPSILLQNMVRRTLRGLPLSTRVKRTLSNSTDKLRGVLEDQVGKMFAVATERERKLLRCLVIDLVMEGILPPKSKLLATAGLGQQEKAKLLPPPKFKLMSSVNVHLSIILENVLLHLMHGM